MKPGIRLVCSDCLRSLDWSEHDVGPRPKSCSFCGGPVESQIEEPSEEEFATPLSLELTPDETEWAPLHEPDAGDPLLNSVGRFQLRELLGGGGFGHVYRAYDPRLDRDVALKVLREVHPTGRVMERFFREARAAAQLDHPHIVPLLDAGRDDGRCWIAYQFVEGQTLGRIRDLQGVDYEGAARVVRALAEALDHAHRRGVYHRDLKPSNVILDESGRPRLIDFGLAKRSNFEPALTGEGTVLGTPAYMSPEQASGRSHEADARSDIYSLGVMLYELVCNQRPADLPSSVPVWRAETRGPTTPPRSLNPKVPRALDRICRKALAPLPDDRYTDARALADDIQHWLKGQRRAAVLHRAASWSAVLIILAVALSRSFGFPISGSRGQAGETHRPPPVEPEPDASVRPAPAVRIVMRRPTARLAPSTQLFQVPGSRFFHQRGCTALDAAAPETWLAFATPREAEAKGLLACTFCRPSEPAAEQP